MLKATNLVMRYGAYEALFGVSFEARRGEITALIGPNGAGKTTTIKLITGMLLPAGGEVHLDGRVLTRDNLKLRSEIGYVPDRPEIYPQLTAREYARFVGGLYGIRARDTDKAIAPLFERFQMSSVTDELLGSFSHGMRQKAVLVATLARNPSMIVLDEPLVGLDPMAALTLEEIIAERAEEGAIILFSTHLLDIAERIADRIVMINAGRVQLEGDRESLLGGDSDKRQLASLYFQFTSRGESLNAV